MPAELPSFTNYPSHINKMSMVNQVVHSKRSNGKMWTRKKLFLLSGLLSSQSYLRGRAKRFHFLLAQSALEKRQSTQSQFFAAPRFRTFVRRKSAAQPRPETGSESESGSDPAGVDAANPRREAERFRHLRMSAQHRTSIKKSSGKCFTELKYSEVFCYGLFSNYIELG